MQSNEWLKDPALADIDSEKLELLQMLVFEGKNLPREKMMPFLLNASRRLKASKITFTDSEMQRIIDCLRNYATEDDLVQINKVMELLASRNKH